MGDILDPLDAGIVCIQNSADVDLGLQILPAVVEWQRSNLRKIRGLWFCKLRRWRLIDVRFARRVGDAAYPA